MNDSQLNQNEQAPHQDPSIQSPTFKIRVSNANGQPRLQNEKRNSNPFQNRKSVFSYSIYHANAPEDQDEASKNTERKKIGIEELNRNKRFLQNFLQNDFKIVAESRENEQSDPVEFNQSQTNSITNQIGLVSSQPLRRCGNAIRFRDSDRDNNRSQSITKLAKNVVSGNKKGKKQKLQNKAHHGDTGSNSKFKIFKFTQRKTLKEQLQQGEQENDEYEEFLKEIKDKSVTKRWLLYPDSSIRMIIDFISFCIILYIAAFIPLMFSFLNDSEILAFQKVEISIDFWFLIEIVLNFNTAYYDRRRLIVTKKLIALNYVKSWFIPDLVSSFPFSLIYFNEDSSFGVAQTSTKIFRVIRLVKYLRFLRILRFIKASKAIQNIEEYFITETSNFFAKLLKFILLTLFLSHWLACLFYGIGLLDQENMSQSWIIENGYLDCTTSEKYINSLYWAITTMTTVGMGDITPTTTHERIAGVFTVILSSCLFGFIIQDIGKMVSNFNLLANQFKEKITYVEQFMRNNDLPSSLRIQIRRYLDYCVEQKSIQKIDEDDLMGLLNDDLKCKLQVHLYGGIFSRIKLINSFSVELLSSLTFILVKQSFTVNEDLFVEGDLGSQIYYITSGKIAILHKESKTFIKDLYKKQYFGEVAFFTDLTRQASAKARDFSELLVLDRKAFIDIASTINPKSLVKLTKICEGINYEKRDFKALQLSCYLCEVVGHISINCGQFENTIKGNISKYYTNISKKKPKSKALKSTQPENELKFNLQENNLIKGFTGKSNLLRLNNFNLGRSQNFENDSEQHSYEIQKSENQENQLASKVSPFLQIQNEKELHEQALQSNQEDLSNQQGFLYIQAQKKETGKKNVQRASNWLTIQVAKKKRFSSVEKRKVFKKQNNQDKYGRVIKFIVNTKPIEQGDQRVKNIEGSSPAAMVRNVFHPDYQEKINQIPPDFTQVVEQVSKQTALQKVYKKLLTRKLPDNQGKQYDFKNQRTIVHEKQKSEKLITAAQRMSQKLQQNQKGAFSPCSQRSKKEQLNKKWTLAERFIEEKSKLRKISILNQKASKLKLYANSTRHILKHNKDSMLQFQEGKEFYQHFPRKIPQFGSEISYSELSSPKTKRQLNKIPERKRKSSSLRLQREGILKNKHNLGCSPQLN